MKSVALKILRHKKNPIMDEILEKGVGATYYDITDESLLLNDLFIKKAT